MKKLQEMDGQRGRRMGNAGHHQLPPPPPPPPTPSMDAGVGAEDAARRPQRWRCSVASGAGDGPTPTVAVPFKSALKNPVQATPSSGSTDSGFAGSAYADNEGEASFLWPQFSSFDGKSDAFFIYLYN